jgi:SAM-dependent methyltransferase
MAPPYQRSTIIVQSFAISWLGIHVPSSGSRRDRAHGSHDRIEAPVATSPLRFPGSGEIAIFAAIVGGSELAMASSASTDHWTDGAAYEVFLGRCSRRLAAALLDFAAFPDEGALLDVGCGTGSLACTMAERWPRRRIVGVDCSEPFIAVARSRALAHPPVFAVGDATVLPLDAAAFAGAASQLVLNFVPAAAAVAEMRRVTRRSGRVVAAVFDFCGGGIFQRLFWDTAAAIDPEAVDRRGRMFAAPAALPGGLLDLFIKAGLVRIEDTLITIRLEYSDFEGYWRPLLGIQGPTGRYIAGLAPDLRERIEAAVRAAYCAGAPDGPRAMSTTAWAVRGIVP